MGKIKIVVNWLLVISFWGMVSCTDDETGTESPVPVPVVLKASIYEFQATEGTVWKSGESFGVFMLKSGTEEVVGNYSNLLYTTDDYSATGYLIPSGDPMYYPADGSKVDVIAYYPYQPNVTMSRASGYQVTLDLSDSKKVKADDFIYSKEGQGLGPQNKSYELQLKPVLSKIVVNLMPGNGVTDQQLQDMDFSLKGMHTLGTFDLVHGQFLSLDNVQEVPMVKSGDSYGREIVVFPGEVQEEMKLTAEVKTETGEVVKLEVSLDEVVEHAEENTEYEIGVKVTPEGLEPTLVGTSPIYILDWQDDKENVEDDIVVGLPNLVKDGKLDELSADQLVKGTSVPATPYTWFGMANQVEATFDVYREPKQGNVLSMSFGGSLAWYKNYIGYTSQKAEATGYQLTFKARSTVPGAKLQVYVRINKNGNHFFVLQDADLAKPCAAYVCQLTSEWTTYVVDFDFTQTVNTLYTPQEGGVVATTQEDRNNFYIAFTPQQTEVEYCIDDITLIKQEYN